MAARGRPSLKEKDEEDAKALGPDRVPENQKREVYERVRRALEAKNGGCTSHKVGSSQWDKHEQKVLEDGLRYYSHDRHSNLLIYIRIAASLPKKTVRDVAHHLRHMQEELRSKLDAAVGMNPAKRHHPDPAAAAAIAAMHEHQMAAIFAANAGMAPMHTLPGLAQGLGGPGGPGPHLKDEEVEARVSNLLQENMTLLSSIRENMMMGRFFDNHALMIAFDKNIKELTGLLATLPFGEMQKLPVQVNPYFITGALPPGVGPPQPVDPHLPPGPPVAGVVHQATGIGSGNGNTSVKKNDSGDGNGNSNVSDGLSACGNGNGSGSVGGNCIGGVTETERGATGVAAMAAGVHEAPTQGRSPPELEASAAQPPSPIPLAQQESHAQPSPPAVADISAPKGGTMTGFLAASSDTVVHGDAEANVPGAISETSTPPAPVGHAGGGGIHVKSNDTMSPAKEVQLAPPGS